MSQKTKIRARAAAAAVLRKVCLSSAVIATLFGCGEAGFDGQTTGLVVGSAVVVAALGSQSDDADEKGSSNCLNRSWYEESTKVIQRYEVVNSSIFFRATENSFDPGINTSAGPLVKRTHTTLENSTVLPTTTRFEKIIGNVIESWSVGELENGVFSVNKLFDNKIFDLDVGQSAETAGLIATFLGKEEVVVPAGSFVACHFEMHSNGLLVLENWIAVDSGLLVKGQEFESGEEIRLSSFDVSKI